MKRSRDDDKVMGPLFPRLHVNDADKGGPRGPPRNKMALYELFSIPSQRFNSDAGATLPKQLQRAGSLAASAFSSQGRGHERSVSSPFCTPHTPVHMAEKVHPHSVGVINQDAMSMDLERKSSNHGSRGMTNSAGNVQMDVKRSSLHPGDLSSVKVPFGKKSGDEDDFRVPTCVQPGIVLNSDKDHHSMDREGTIDSNLNSPQKNGAPAFSSQGQVQSNHGKTLERHHTHSSMLQQHESSNEGKAKETVTLGMSMEDPMSHSAIREKAVDPSKICRPSSNEGHPSYKLIELNTSQGGNVRQCQESHGSFGERRYLSDSEFKEKQVISNGRTESCSKMSLDRGLLEPSIPEYCDLSGEEVTRAEGAERTDSPEDANKTGMLEDADRNDDVSETSIVDSMPGVDICPDDVVGLIGSKHFWKARRALVNQQRVFAVQVFELHRLIKVQKLIAGSPHLLLEETSYLHGSPEDPVTDPSARFRVKPHLQVKQKDEPHKVNNSECATENTESANLLVYPRVKIIKHKDESHKAICNSECATEHTGDNLPLPHEHGKGPISQLPRDGSCPGKVSSFPAPSDNSGAWCFHPPGNQLLIPVMSPSEGLIYKPYTGPCPPSGAFMAPVYGGCGPLSVPSVAGDLMKPAFGVPIPHQQQGMAAFPGAPAVAPNYFAAPYGLPVVNPLISSSPVEPVRSMAGPRPSAPLEQQSRSSCNMSNLRREATSENALKVHVSHENDVQASTASCASDRSHGDVHPRFPVASSRDSSGRPPQGHGRDHRARVIKVVPHNARSATASAARIFRSIQKERQQHDSV